MHMRRLIRVSLICVIPLGFNPMKAQARTSEFDLQGQVSGWHIEARNEGERFYNMGIRYIPQVSLLRTIGTDHFVEFEISLNAFTSTGSSKTADDSDVELYRIKLRYATAQTETRLGLQKLNFGPALLLRSLMWFDRLDPRDPLQLTDGVYAARFRYVALNNTSVWFWGLFENDETKGYETFPTADERPEFGGRLQYPVPAGEMAVTVHTRKVNGSLIRAGDFTEYRLALDGRWDVEIGLWFESVFQQQRSDDLPYEWAKIMTFGMDYTFGIGNGLHFLCEHMAVVASEELFGWEEDAQTSAFSLNYPIGYLDNLKAIGFYSWEYEKYYQYLAWQRTWDNLILNVSVFHYPDTDSQRGLYERNVPGIGNGGQITIIYNH